MENANDFEALVSSLKSTIESLNLLVSRFEANAKSEEKDEEIQKEESEQKEEKKEEKKEEGWAEKIMSALRQNQTRDFNDALEAVESLLRYVVGREEFDEKDEDIEQWIDDLTSFEDLEDKQKEFFKGILERERSVTEIKDILSQTWKWYSDDDDSREKLEEVLGEECPSAFEDMIDWDNEWNSYVEGRLDEEIVDGSDGVFLID